MKGRTFLIIALVLIAIDLLIPYLVLADIPRFSASFTFWSVLTAGVIAWAAVYTRKWGRR